ncbi:Rad52/Rad22 family DNA repair protein [Mesorhizobium sp.]|uniref:Rad52/Rad22 family DNA repair protein n=1 Tax=Mesorhizobium sp. TaxID=1871066 RepID=UPI002579E9C4|nr:Rad52/Rad22 family DNA repair protein [Mesorhizobium sp.]
MTIHLPKLKEPFEPDRISWRVGSTMKDKSKGMALAYIDARDVMQRLDDVCGPENWQCDYPHAGTKTVCRIGIKLNDEWVWKSNGAGDTDIESEKGALSDAFKRAAVLWGIGQYLYDLESPWVTLDTQTGNDGKVYVKGIAKHEFTRLHKLLGGKSSSQLGKEEEWTAFQNDLWGCQSVVAIEGLYKELRKTWSGSWLAQAAEACAERKKDILAADSDNLPEGARNLLAG